MRSIGARANGNGMEQGPEFNFFEEKNAFGIFLELKTFSPVFIISFYPVRIPHNPNPNWY